MDHWGTKRSEMSVWRTITRRASERLGLFGIALIHRHVPLGLAIEHTIDTSESASEWHH